MPFCGRQFIMRIVVVSFVTMDVVMFDLLMRMVSSQKERKSDCHEDRCSGILKGPAR